MLSSRRTESSTFRSAPPDTVVLPCVASPRPAHSVSEFYTRKVRIPLSDYMSNPNREHTIGRSRQGDARRSAGASRGPISIFGPIFKVENRSEGPDLWLAERSLWLLVEGGL